ncbi:MAG: HEAT repeat domain-containing protein [Acidobacteriaceae bacterium]
MNDRVSSWHDIQCLVQRNVLRLVVGFTLFPGPTYGQATQSQSDPLAASIARAKTGDVSNADVETIAKARAVQAIPALEVQFARTTDLDTKAKIADGLVRLGDNDNTYWNFLLQQATLAVDSDLPAPFHDSQGNATGRELSPEFKAWVQAHNVDVSTAVRSAIYDLPGKVLQLGEAVDPRGIPLLRRALQSHNPMIVIMASKGLAQIQDKDSIPLIIDACRMAPKGYDGAIAESSLVFFDDPQAQSAVDTYVPKQRAKIIRDARAHGMKPLGY